MAVQVAVGSEEFCVDLRRKINFPFPLDLILCDVCRLARRVEAGDFFLQDAVRFGKLLYESPDRSVDVKA